MPDFNANAGGHAPGHLRGFFWALLEVDSAEALGNWPKRLPLEGDPLVWIAGQLRNCTDIMPWPRWEGLVDLSPGSTRTYAAAARQVMRLLADPSSQLSLGRGEREEMCATARLDIAASDAAWPPPPRGWWMDVPYTAGRPAGC